MKTFFKNEHGFAIVYGLVVLLLASVGGTSLLFMARKDRIGVSDYSKMRSASQAAAAALKACEGQFQKDPIGALAILKKYTGNNSYKWLLGTAGNANIEQKIKFWNGADAPQYSANIVGFDDNACLIQIEGIGYGSYGGKKRAIASYHLGGLTKVITASAGTKYAIYVSGAGRNFDQKVTINGDVYFGGNFMFNSSADGSIINGNLKTGIVGAVASEFNAGVTINGHAYFQTAVKCQNSPVTINGIAGFEKSLDLPSSNFTINGDAFFNSSKLGTGKVDMTLHQVTHSGSCSPSNFTHAPTIIDNGGPINIAAQLDEKTGNDIPCTIDISVIPAAKIRSFPLLNMPDLRGDWLDQAYEWHKNNGYLWNDFLVLSVKQQSEAPTINSGAGGDFHQKVIWILENASVAVNNKWYSSDPGALTLIYVKNGGSLVNFGWQGLFRGYINVTGTGGIVYKLQPGASIAGAIHHVSDNAGFQMNNNLNLINIHYDPTVISALSDIGVLKCPAAAPAPGPVGGTLTLVDVKIRPTLLGMQL